MLRDSSPNPNSSARNRCVVLVADPQAYPKRLVAGLEARGTTVAAVFDAPWVMVELVAGAHSFIVCEPALVPQLHELLQAIRTYYPSVRFWSYGRETAGQVPSLHRMGDVREDEPRQSSASANQSVSELATQHAASAPAVIASHGVGLPPPPNEPSHAAPISTPTPQPEQTVHEVAARQFQNVVAQMHEQTVRPSRLSQAQRSDDDNDTPLITADELAMLIGPAAPREEQQTREAGDRRP